MKHYDEDMIDFRCSDSYRDFYALQGLTYPAGRTPRPAAPQRPLRDDEAWQSIGEIFKTLREQHAEINRLKHAGSPPPDAPQNGFEGVE